MTTIAIPGGANPEIREAITKAKQKFGSKIDFTIYDVEDNGAGDYHFVACSPETVISKAVKSVATGEAQILMKGIVQTHDLLKEVLKKEYDLRQQKLLSHVAMIHLPQMNRPILLTDSGMNIAPDVEQLVQIADNAITTAQKIGIEEPKVALLSSAEIFNPKMPSSVLAKEVTERMQDRRAIVYGPLSLDLALSKEAVAHKHFTGPIAGDADVLVVPTIDTGNVLYKSLLLFGQAVMGGTIVGTKVPIVLTSRSDSAESKLLSLEFAMKQLGGEEHE